MPTTRVATTLLPLLQLSGLLAQQPPADPVEAAVAKMRATGRAGLCFVMPTAHAELGGAPDEETVRRLRADFAERIRQLGPAGMGDLGGLHAVTPVATPDEHFATLLHRLLLTSDPRAKLLLVEAVLLVAPAATVGARAGENLVLLDERGRRFAGTQIDLADDASFVRGADALLQASRRPAAPERARELRAALARAASTDEAERRTAVAVLARPEGVAALQRAIALSCEQPASHLDEAANAVVEEIGGGDRAGLLPFGAQWQHHTPAVDPCPPCGMMRISAPASRLLALVAR